MNVELLRGLGKAERFAKNHMVFMEGEAGSDMYIVLKGMFGVYINSFADFPVRVADITAGSFFGEMSVIDHWPRSATIISEEDSIALRIGQEHLSELFEKSPDIAVSILSSLYSRVMSTADLLRKSGREAPELPLSPESILNKDVKSAISLLTDLSQKIREMNALLSLREAVHKQEDRCGEVRPEIARLLPEGYAPLHLADDTDNREKLRLIDVICPYCGMQFQAYIPLFSALDLSRQFLDGRMIYSNINILYYTNLICSNCNYTDSYLQFSTRKYPADQPDYLGNQFPNEENFTGYGRKLNHTFNEAVLSYYQNINCLSRVSDDPLRYAKAWIRLYWLFSDLNNREISLHAAERADHYYGRYLQEWVDFIPEENQMRLRAILGELSAARGDYRQALWHYEQSLAIGAKSHSSLLNKHRVRYNEIKRI